MARLTKKIFQQHLREKLAVLDSDTVADSALVELGSSPHAAETVMDFLVISDDLVAPKRSNHRHHAGKDAAILSL